MPGLVGGFGKLYFSFSQFIFLANSLLLLHLPVLKGKKHRRWNTIYISFKVFLDYIFYFFVGYNAKYNQIRPVSVNKLNQLSKKINRNINNSFHMSPINKDGSSNNIGPYLAGLIEGDGTFAIKNGNNKSTITNKNYNPKIIVVFKKSDLPLATFFKNYTNCGEIFIKPERGYVLWQIQDIVSLFTILNIINEYMRTPKCEAKNRAIEWLNLYIEKNINNPKAQPKTLNILKQIHPLLAKPIDNSPIDSNSWLSGFSDADANFSINIHKRSDKNSTRVQLYYRLEIKQNYHITESDGKKASFFPLMSQIGMYLGVTVHSRSRSVKDKNFHSFTVISQNKISNLKILDYFSKYPLLSSKYLDFKDWAHILDLQNSNPVTTSYLDKAKKIRTDFNSTRTTYNWDHLKYLGKAI